MSKLIQNQIAGRASGVVYASEKFQEYAFVDTNVESNIEYAFQALALDEHRGPFTPTIWAAPIDPPRELKQC